MEFLPATQLAIYGDVGHINIVAALAVAATLMGARGVWLSTQSFLEKRVRWFTPGQVLRMATGSIGELLSPSVPRSP